MKILTTNRSVSRDYFIIDKWDAGIVLKGTEIKSLRESQASIAEAWVKIINGEAWLIGSTINEYSQAREAWKTHDPTRERKLLLKRAELTRIERELTTGITIVPLDIHLSDRNFAKVTIALVKGKKNYDKRETIKERDLNRLGGD